MKRLLGAIAILLMIGLPASAYYLPMPPIVPPEPPPLGALDSGSQKFICAANPAGAFICLVVAGIIVHEVMGPPCARPGLANGYDHPTFWRPLCKDPAPTRTFVGK